MSFNGAGRFHPLKVEERIRKNKMHNRFFLEGLHLITDREEFDKKLMLLLMKDSNIDEKMMRELFDEQFNFHEKMKRNKMPYQKLLNKVKTLINS